MTGSLAKKIAVVTGAANGIGLAVATRFASEGAYVAMLDREADALEEGRREIAKAGGQVAAFLLDLTDRTAVTDTFQTIAAEMGNVDILINNAGGSARARNSEFWCSKPEVWDYVIDLNLKSAMNCARQVVPAMRERRSGKIVNFSSGSFNAGDVDIADYVAAKGGVVGFTRSLARELAPFAVNVNAIGPGPIATRAAQRAAASMERSLVAVPMRRPGRPDEIASAAVFLSSDQSDYITGQVLMVDGGRSFN